MRPTPFLASRSCPQAGREQGSTRSTAVVGCSDRLASRSRLRRLSVGSLRCPRDVPCAAQAVAWAGDPNAALRTLPFGGSRGVGACDFPPCVPSAGVSGNPVHNTKRTRIPCEPPPHSAREMRAACSGRVLATEWLGGTVSASRRKGGGSSFCSQWSLNHVASGSAMRHPDTLALVRDTLALGVDGAPWDTLGAPIAHVGDNTVAAKPAARAVMPGLCALIHPGQGRSVSGRRRLETQRSSCRLSAESTSRASRITRGPSCNWCTTGRTTPTCNRLCPGLPSSVARWGRAGCRRCACRPFQRQCGEHVRVSRVRLADSNDGRSLRQAVRQRLPGTSSASHDGQVAALPDLGPGAQSGNFRSRCRNAIRPLAAAADHRCMVSMARSSPISCSRGDRPTDDESMLPDGDRSEGCVDWQLAFRTPRPTPPRSAVAHVGEGQSRGAGAASAAPACSRIRMVPPSGAPYVAPRPCSKGISSELPEPCARGARLAACGPPTALRNALPRSLPNGGAVLQLRKRTDVRAGFRLGPVLLDWLHGND